MRVYAEDPTNNFLPDTGLLKKYVRPQGAGIRVDDGYEEGQEVSIYYDPMIAKLITYGKDRAEAIARMRRAIYEYKIIGLQTTLPFCDFVLQHPEFVDGSFTTKFVESNFTPEVLSPETTNEEADAIALVVNELVNNSKPKPQAKSNTSTNTKSRWKERAHN